VPSLKTFTQRERYQNVIQYWLLGLRQRQAESRCTLAAWACTAGIGDSAGTSIGILLWLAAIVALAAIDSTKW
jgi:hypothetical protein